MTVMADIESLMETKVRKQARIETIAGVRKYKEPIGTPIVQARVPLKKPNHILVTHHGTDLVSVQTRGGKPGEMQHVGDHPEKSVNVIHPSIAAADDHIDEIMEKYPSLTSVHHRLNGGTTVELHNDGTVNYNGAGGNNSPIGTIEGGGKKIKAVPTNGRAKTFNNLHDALAHLRHGPPSKLAKRKAANVPLKISQAKISKVATRANPVDKATVKQSAVTRTSSGPKVSKVAARMTPVVPAVVKQSASTRTTSKVAKRIQDAHDALKQYSKSKMSKRFSDKLDALSSIPKASLKDASPKDIDTIAYQHYKLDQDLRQTHMHVMNGLHVTAGDKKTGPFGRRAWEMTDKEAYAKTKEIASGNTYDSASAQRSLDALHENLADKAANDAVADMYEAEYERRPWSRAFLVTNGNGHIHKTMSCSTCNNGRTATQFAWITDLSGHKESEIVEKAGEKACTVCYPSAPANPSFKQPSQIFEPEAYAAKQSRIAARAAKAASDKAKGITNSDGSTLTVGEIFPDKLRTERAAELWLVDKLHTQRAYGYSGPSAKDLNAVIAALAGKRGESVAKVRADIDAKVAAKTKREASRR